MTARDFAFWLQGFFELYEPCLSSRGHQIAITANQAAMIQRHLALVFKHEIDPSMPDKTGELQAVHDGADKPVQMEPPKANDQYKPTYRC